RDFRRLIVAASDDLRQLNELSHGAALGDPLGTERNMDAPPSRAQQRVDLLSGPRIDGAPKNDALAVDEIWNRAEEEAADCVERGVEVLVNRRADDDDNVT